jgi:hypothetical protein
MFFNTGEATPGSYLNDVFAYITVGRALDSEDPLDTLRVYGRVVLCNDAGCSNFTTIGSQQDLGTVKLNQKVKLRVTWDPGGNRFIFQKGKGAEFYVTNTVNVGGSPGASNGGYKRLQIQNVLPNCTSDPRPMGFIDASFDNIMVNESAIP